jgi:alkylated DNA repair protein alkB family protein 8
LSPDFFVADIGCGNGKYLNYKNMTFIGIDACPELAEIASHKGIVIIGNVLNLPLRNSCVDAVICIALLHHISKDKRRIVVEEIKRICQGPILFTVWRDGIEKENWKSLGNGDWLVPWNNKFYRYYHLFTMADIHELFQGYKYTIYEEMGNWYISMYP